MGVVSASAPAQTKQRPDASMSLLTTLLGQSLDPGYAEASARRVDDPATRWRHRALLVVGLVAIGALLTFAAMQTHFRLPANDQARALLIEQVQQRSATTDALQQQVATLRAQVTKAQGDVLALTESGRQVAARLNVLELASGTTPVVGPGLRLTIDDAANTVSGADGNPRTGSGPAEGTVRDRDLQQVVNGLWAAGAEAVAVDGHRLSALTAIRAAGEAILVDYRAISPPYVIEAIGDKAALEAGFVASSGGAYLQTIANSFGVRYDVKRVDALSLPGAETLRLERAQAPKEGS